MAHATNHVQPMSIDLVEDVGAVVLASTSPGGITGKGRAVATHEVCAHAATCISDAYRFHQVPDDIQPVPIVLGDIQDVDMDSIPGSAKIAIGLVDTAMAPLDTMNTGYRQTLSTFITVVNGIIGVCHPNARRSSLTDNHP